MMGKKEPEITVEQAIKVIWDELYKAVKPIVDLIAKYDLPIPPPRPSITWNDGKGNLHKTFVDQMKPEDQEIIKDMMRPVGHISIGTPMKSSWVEELEILSGIEPFTGFRSKE